MMSNERKLELKEKILLKLSERYEQTAKQCREVQQEYVQRLEREARDQLDPIKHGRGHVAASMTVREVLEIERNE